MSARRAAKIRHFLLTVAVCMFALTMANVMTLLVPRRFGLVGDDVGSAIGWASGRLFDLPVGLAVTMWLLMVLVGFAWRRHTGYSRAVVAWAAAAAGCVAISFVAGTIIQSIPVGMVWFVLPEVLWVSAASTVAFAVAGVVGVLAAHAAQSMASREPRHAALGSAHRA